MIRTAAALLLFAVCAQPCVGQPGPQGDALQFHARCLGSGGNSFIYYKFSTKQHEIQPGDFLEYDVYQDAVTLEPRACVDLQYTDGRDLRDGTVQAGRELNTPLLVFAAKELGDAERCHFAVAPKNVILEAIKKAEDSDALILRLFEYAGEDCVARLKLLKPPKRVTETDLLEQEIGTLEAEGHTAVVPMGHNAITTVKVEF